jgi:hypothetical protein
LLVQGVIYDLGETNGPKMARQGTKLLIEREEARMSVPHDFEKQLRDSIVGHVLELSTSCD